MRKRTESVVESQPTVTRERAPRWKRAIAAGEIGVAAVLTLTNCSSQVDPNTLPPSVSAEPTPTKTAMSQAELDKKIAEIKIPAGLDNQALANAVIDRSNKWLNAGTNDSSLWLRLAQPGATRDSVGRAVALDQQKAFAPTLYGPNWPKDPAIAQAVQKQTDGNARTVSLWLATAKNNRFGDPVPYQIWSEMTGVTVVSQTPTARHLRINYNNFDRADPNVVAPNTIDKYGQDDVTLTPVNGSEVITSDSWSTWN